MAQILIRNLDPKIVHRLKAQAKENGRSLQAEAKQIIESTVKYTPAEFWDIAAKLREQTRGRPQTDSALLIREDRDR